MIEVQQNWQEIGDWKGGRVRSSAKVTIWVSLLFGVAFIGLGLPVSLAVPEELAKGNTLALIALLFPMIGIAALGIFFHALLGWFKFSASEIELDPVPGSIGGDFGGRIETRIPYRANLRVSTTLTCQHQRTTGTGKNRSTSTSIRWQREGVATVRRAGARTTEISFRFAIPTGLPASESASDNCHQWVLQLDCAVPGVDFNRAFIVPVFDSALPALSSFDIPYARHSAPIENAPEHIVRVRTERNTLYLYFPWYRRWGSALSLQVFGALFIAAGVFAGEQSGSMLFPLVFGAVGALVASIGLYMIGNTLSAEISAAGVTSRRCIYGFTRCKQAAVADISHLQQDIGSSARSGNRQSVYYRLIAHTYSGEKIPLADSLPGSRLADFIEARIRTVLWPE